MRHKSHVDSVQVEGKGSVGRFGHWCPRIPSLLYCTQCILGACPYQYSYALSFTDCVRWSKAVRVVFRYDRVSLEAWMVAAVSRRRTRKRRHILSYKGIRLIRPTITVGVYGALQLEQSKRLDARVEWNKGRGSMEEVTPGPSVQEDNPRLGGTGNSVRRGREHDLRPAGIAET